MPEWTSLLREPASLVALPVYAWQRERHWFEPAGPQTRPTYIDEKQRRHPLLGGRVRSARPTWENLIGSGDTEYLAQHIANEAPVYPGAAYVEQAAAAAGILTGQTTVLLRNVEFLKALRLNANGSTAIQLCADADAQQFEVFAAYEPDANSWVRHAKGSFSSMKSCPDDRVDIDSVKAGFAVSQSTDDFYNRMAERGLSYGPVFRGIRNLWAGDGRALAYISVAGLNAVANYNIHPALLDAAFQVLVAAADCDPALAAERRLFLPIRIEEIRILSTLGEAFWALAQVTDVGDSSVRGDIRLFDTNGKICADVTSLTARRVEARGGSGKSMDSYLYEYNWEVEPRPALPAVVPPTGESEVQPLVQVFSGIADAADNRSAETNWEHYYSSVENRLNELAYSYILRAFSLLGCQLRRGFAFSPDIFGTTARSGWRRSLSDNLLELLERPGFIQRSGNEWVVIQDLPQPESELIAEAILRDFPNHRLDVDLLTRCGPRLTDVLTGVCDGRDILFSEDGFEFLERFYRESPASSFYNALAAHAVRALAAAQNQTPLRVLEVGGGTGGTTSHILPVLDATRTSYLFTDASPLFLESAKRKFARYPYVATKLFDLVRDPKEQGISPGSFDIIVGSNVLHATPDLASSVRRLQELLAPGGVLLLLEITRHPYWLDIVFGLMDGWWKFEDRKIRPSHPLMPGGRWQSLLEGSGLTETCIVADRPSKGEPAQSLIAGRKPATTAGSRMGTWLICADRRGVGRRLAGILEQRGYGCVLVYAGPDYARPSSFTYELQPENDEQLSCLVRELQPLLPHIQGVVHTWSVDINPPAAEKNSDVTAAATAGCAGIVGVLRQVVLNTPLKTRRFAIVTAGAQVTGELASEPISLLQSPAWGFGRTLVKELPDLECMMIDLSAGCTDLEITSLADSLCSEHSDGFEEEIAFRNETRFVRRLRKTSLDRIADSAPLIAASADPWLAEIATTGSLDSISFRQTELAPPGDNQIQVEVGASSLNFRDIVLAMGIIPGLEESKTFGRQKLGSDFAGVVTRCGKGVTDFNEGDEVFGIAPGTIASHISTNSDLIAHKPRTLDMEQASGIPVAFVTAWYGLKRLARLSAGESVLIHSASGGVGLAAIQIGKYLGAHIFATAGSPAKRAYLESLGIDGVMDSRTLSFAREVRERTGGGGVDVVLNSLPGEAMQQGISALAPYGRFVELGKADIYQDRSLGLHPFRRNLTYFAVDLDRMSFEKPEWVGEMLREIAAQLESGVFAPLPGTNFKIAQVTEAMRFMAQAKHIGKVVLSHDGEVFVKRKRSDRVQIRRNASYLITGGLGGLGLVTARWLIDCGAEAVVLAGRSKPSEDVEAALADLRAGGARVECVAADVSKEADVVRMLSYIRSNLPPLCGVIHAAMVLDDTPVAELTKRKLDQVIAPKVAGAWYLHRHTQSDPIDFFVSFSSIASLLGNPRQANYSAANAFLDAFAQYRRANGLPAGTINWGVISGSGFVARHQEIADNLARQGYLSFADSQAIEILSELLKRDAINVMAARIDWQRLAEFAPRMADSPRIRHLVPDKERPSLQGSSLRRLLETADPDTYQSCVEQYLCGEVTRLLGARDANLDTDLPITQLGLDSLIATELVGVLERDVGVKIAGSKLLTGLSIRDLAALLLGEMGVQITRESVRQSAVEVVSRQPESPDLPSASAAIVDAGLISDTPALSGGNGGGNHRLSKTDSSAYDGVEYSRWTPSQRILRALSTTAFAVLGNIEAYGLENIPATGACLMAVNHLSMADIPLALQLLPRRATILVNEKYSKRPIFSWLLTDIGQSIYVSPNELDEEPLRRAVDVLNRGGLVALAPEAQRSKSGRLLRGRTGVAYLATQLSVPVVPFVAWGQEKWRRRLTSIRRIPISVRVGKPLYFPTGPTPPNLLRQYTDEIMLALAALLPPDYRGVYSTIDPGKQSGRLPGLV
jgi:NADPH:quinone reductase-like Zn-dependent oxidoreductase/1-acyl-sn-glycerol-3-phosphate acyltransferase/SAM-dependent methyltransferase/acyl carrier protein